jgi:transposase
MEICKEVEGRRKMLEQAEKLKEKGLKLREIGKIIGGSERTIKRWRKAKKELGIIGLVPLNKRPQQLVQARKLTRTVIRKIGELRKENPYYGKVKIRELLLRENIKISLSCVGNALKKLMDANIVT